MKHLNINASTGGGGVGVGMIDIEALEGKWEVKLNEVAAQIDGMDVFTGGRWFGSRMECVDFAEKHIPAGQFQWFLYIISYLQFVTGETGFTPESHQD